MRPLPLDVPGQFPELLEADGGLVGREGGVLEGHAQLLVVLAQLGVVLLLETLVRHGDSV